MKTAAGASARPPRIPNRTPTTPMANSNRATAITLQAIARLGFVSRGIAKQAGSSELDGHQALAIADIQLRPDQRRRRPGQVRQQRRRCRDLESGWRRVRNPQVSVLIERDQLVVGPD